MNTQNQTIMHILSLTECAPDMPPISHREAYLAWCEDCLHAIHRLAMRAAGTARRQGA